MSFRGRLSLFFTIIVVVPMVAVALVLFSLTADSETGKSDARIAQALQVAIALSAQERREARQPLARVARDPELGRALASGNAAAIERRFGQLRSEQPTIAAIVLDRARGGDVRSGTRNAVAFATAAPTTTAGRRVGTLGVSVTSARRLAEQTRRQTRLDSRILIGDRVAASTLRERGTRRATDGDVDVDGVPYRGRFQAIRSSVGPTERVGVFEESRQLGESVSQSRFLIGGILLAFLLLSLVSSVFVVRALQGQVDQFLQAARRLGQGDFSRPVPIQGSDEFALLGQEFNEMAKQLEAKIEEVEGKRRELEQSIRRVGEAFAAGLDRQGIVDLAMDTAMNACAAEAGRAVPIDKRSMKASYVGEDSDRMRAAMERAEARALEGTDPVVASEANEVHALAVPLRAQLSQDEEQSNVGVLSIARSGEAFIAADRDLFAYLAGQAAVSIENADLHETVQEQAVTDTLTGLHNLRHFHETLDGEVERSRRFGTDTGLAMLDIDNFKRVNDTYGHQQGDLVLQEVAGVLRELSRDIDEPARYGGEEMVVVLPQTDLGGAELLAERMRAAIEDLVIDRLDGDGTLKVTASFGVASLPSTAAERDDLIAAADAALYKAKRSGKNRVERAEAAPAAS
ncbi:MAG: diguanylate cyclase [Thermoleophilaceae bacterium]|nr:diguanylate cyclase [Thermoleophilaceae bacterium]